MARYKGSTIVFPPKATQPQAEAGTRDDVYMTPLRTKQAIAAKLGG